MFGKALKPLALFILCIAFLSGPAQSAVFNYPPLPGERAYSLGLAINQQGHPVVAWGNETKQELPVWEWNGSQWNMLGKSGLGGPNKRKSEGASTVSSGFAVPYPALAINPTGHPVVAWVHDGETYLQVWDGEKWFALGGSASGGGISNSGGYGAPSLALDSRGNPFVTWQALSSDAPIDLRFWNGSVWSELGNSAHGAGLSDHVQSLCRPAIAMDRHDQPFVVWYGPPTPPETGLFGGVFLKYWNKGRWDNLGGSGVGLGLSKDEDSINDVALALDPDGHPLVAWLAHRFSSTISSTDVDFGEDRILLRQWNGKQWIELNGSATGEGVYTTKDDLLCELSMALDGKGRPIVACAEGAMLYIRRWTGSQWVRPDLSGMGIGVKGGFKHLTIKADGSGILFLAWIDNSNPSASLIRVSKLDMRE